MSFKSLTVGIGLLVVAAATTLAVHKASQEANAREKAMKGEMERLRDELSSVQTTTAALARAGIIATSNRAEGLTSRPEAAAPASSHPAVEQHPVLPTNPMEILEAERQRSRENSLRHAERLDAFLAIDGVDAPWRDKSEVAIHTIFASMEGTRLIETDCASHICRVRLEHASRRDQKSLAPRISTTPPFDQQVFYHYDKERVPPTTTLYVAREGASLTDMGP